MSHYNLGDPSVNANPFPTFDRMRAEDPVHWSPSMKAWLFTRYDDVKRVALNNEHISANRLTPFFEADPARAASGIDNLMRYLTHWMVFRDPPDHTRLRKLFSRAFSSRSVREFRPGIEEMVEHLLENLAAKHARGELIDWIADFAYPLPATVIMDLLGVPRDDLQRVKVWSDEIALFIGTAQAASDKYPRAEEGARAMAEYFRSIIEERTAEPRDDMISQLVLVREEDETLTTDEVIGTCIMLLFAGHETTTNLIGNGFYYTMRNRDQWERLQSDSTLVTTAIEEWLRYDGPSGALARVVAAEVEFDGKTLQKGQRIFAFVNAANRDPAQFPSPNAFDLGRSPNPHLTFGHGIHFCLGAPLARLEGQIALGALVERFPSIHLIGAEPEWNDSIILRGMKSLPVALQ